MLWFFEGLFCATCKAYTPPRKGGLKVWTEVPCITIERPSLTKHQASDAHVDADKAETAAKAAAKDGGIAQALTKQVNLERVAFLGALRAMYWLNTNEVPHTTKFAGLLDMMKGLGLSYLSHLNKGGNCNYTSEGIMWEMVQVLSDGPRQEVISTLLQSPYYSILIDETTDISVTKQLIIFGRYLTKKHEVRTSYLGILDIPDGKADTIVNKLKEFLRSIGADLTKMAGFGSDGAAVMVGRRSGVATQLRANNSMLVNIHCIAHRLALACGQAAQGNTYLIKFKDLLGQLYRFYEYSPVRMSGLQEIQNIVNSKDSCVKLKQAKDVRWLSHHLAVEALRKTFSAVVISLEREAEERHEAVAKGLAVFLKTFRFCATLLMMSDILPTLANLSRLFQQTDVNFSNIKINVDSTVDSLEKLKVHHADHFKGLDKFLAEAKTKTGTEIKYGESDMEQFKKTIYEPFIDQIVTNLKERFPDTELLAAFTIFHPDEAGYDQTQKLELLSKHYSSEVTSAEAVNREYSVLTPALYQYKAQDKELSTNKVLRKVMQVHGDTMPNLAKLAAAMAVLPVSTADCERGFSTMKRIKTQARNQLKESTLDNLLMISIEGPPADDYNFGAACDRWNARRRRRLNTTE
ncbi:zinc finger protein 862-like [Branchiostoma floridae x Branchiostoma japonicum]